MLRAQPLTQDRDAPWGFEGQPRALRFDGSDMEAQKTPSPSPSVPDLILNRQASAVHAFDIVLSQLRPVYHELEPGVMRLHPDLCRTTKDTIPQWCEVVDNGEVKTVRRGLSKAETEWEQEEIAERKASASAALLWTEIADSATKFRFST